MTPLEMARDATPEDTRRIIELQRELFRHANRRGTFDEAAVRSMTDHLRKHGILIISDTGVIGGILIPLYPTGEVVAQEIIWWRDPALVKRFEQRGREMGATATQLMALTERVGRFYERLGYRKIESMYLKEHPL